uniref:Uncharacterized protein n=1 Tax=Anguilla anguilla TaxID=7936 RepID=A0A0E9W8Y0_ANGAN
MVEYIYLCFPINQNISIYSCTHTHMYAHTPTHHTMYTNARVITTHIHACCTHTHSVQCSA